jgi:hypothetical protein
MQNTIIKSSKLTQQINSLLNENARQWIILIISLGCIFLFMSSAYFKIVEHDRFVDGLLKVSYVNVFAKPLSFFVPGFEMSIAVFLIFPRTNLWGLYSFTGLMTVFTLYIVCILLFAKDFPCNCNLLIEKLSWGQHLIFNIGFILLSCIAICLINIKVS